MRLLVLAVLAACGASKATAPPMLTGIVAHRGASQDAPENTLAALRRAWQLGAESSEIDVRVSADGEVVLMHDADTRRIGGRDRPVVAQTLAELRELDVGAWKAPAFRGERIATLGEALDATPPGHMLFVELKTGAGDAAVLAAAILAADPRRRGATVALQAYDPHALAAVGARLPGVETYWTVDPPQAADGSRLPYPPALAAAAAARGFTGSPSTTPPPATTSSTPCSRPAWCSTCGRSTTPR